MNSLRRKLGVWLLWPWIRTVLIDEYKSDYGKTEGWGGTNAILLVTGQLTTNQSIELSLAKRRATVKSENELHNTNS